MATWAKAVRLEGGVAPRFNDSAEDASPPLDQVIAFADGYLQQRSEAQACDVACCRVRPQNQALQLWL